VNKEERDPRVHERKRTREKERKREQTTDTTIRGDDERLGKLQ
jgi:hypothetical protein